MCRARVGRVRQWVCGVTQQGQVGPSGPTGLAGLVGLDLVTPLLGVFNDRVLIERGQFPVL
jgi:hypothetical protein